MFQLLAVYKDGRHERSTTDSKCKLVPHDSHTVSDKLTQSYKLYSTETQPLLFMDANVALSVC